MTPSNGNGTEMRRTLTSVFDLTTFEDTRLAAFVAMPTKPTTIHEALAAVGNDNAVLLQVIYDGLCERAVEAAKQDLSQFKVLPEDAKLPLTAKDIENLPNFTGTPVSEDKGKRINAAVLGIAKALGYEKSLEADEKAKLKAQALDFIKSNPAMLASIQG